MTVHDDSQKRRAIREDEGRGFCATRVEFYSKPPLVSSANPTSDRAMALTGFMFKFDSVALCCRDDIWTTTWGTQHKCDS